MLYSSVWEFFFISFSLCSFRLLLCISLPVLRFNFISLYLRLIFANEPFFGQSREAIRLVSKDIPFFGLVIITTHHNCDATHRERIERAILWPALNFCQRKSHSIWFNFAEQFNRIGVRNTFTCDAVSKSALSNAKLYSSHVTTPRRATLESDGIMVSVFRTAIIKPKFNCNFSLLFLIVPLIFGFLFHFSLLFFACAASENV